MPLTLFGHLFHTLLFLVLRLLTLQWRLVSRAVQTSVHIILTLGTRSPLAKNHKRIGFQGWELKRKKIYYVKKTNRWWNGILLSIGQFWLYCYGKGRGGGWLQGGFWREGDPNDHSCRRKTLKTLYTSLSI